MKIRLLTGLAGYDKKGNIYSHRPGDEIELPPQEARGLLESEQAEPVAVKSAARAEKRPRTPVAAETR